MEVRHHKQQGQSMGQLFKQLGLPRQRASALPAAQSGQAMVLGVLLLFMLALGMYTTYNLGRAVSEKIRLQNIADASAYSMAAMEARTFNFIAFTNRAQISHYVSAMAVQAKISEYTYYEAVLGAAADMLYGFGNGVVDIGESMKSACVFGTYGYSACRATAQGVINAGKAIRDAGDPINTLYQSWHEYVNAIDKVEKYTTYMAYIFNWVLYIGQRSLTYSTVSMLLDSGYEFATKSDPSLRRPIAVGAALGIYNAFRFDRAFDADVGGGAIPFDPGIDWDEGSHSLSVSTPALMTKLGDQQVQDDDALERGQRVMTELVNASRYDDTLTGRKFLDDGENDFSSAITTGINNGLGSIGSVSGHVGEGTSGFSSLLSVFDRRIANTKLVSDKNGSYDAAEALPAIDMSANDKSRLSRGTAMASHDSVSGAPAHAFGIFSGVKNSYHCRYFRRSGLAKTHGGFDRYRQAQEAFFDGSQSGDKVKVRCSGDEDGDGVDDGNHPWPGIAPYMKFNPELRGIGSSSHYDFNQPDVWVWFHRPPGDIAMVGGDLEFSIDSGGVTASYASEIGGDRLPLNPVEGIHVFSRAQAYYHRPGTWKEHPNLFNPYWRARLAPTGDVLQDLASEVSAIQGLGLVSQALADGLVNNFFTH